VERVAKSWSAPENQVEYRCIKEIKVPDQEVFFFGSGWGWSWTGSFLSILLATFNAPPNNLTTSASRKFKEKEAHERSHIYVFVARRRTSSCRLAVNEFAGFFILPWIYGTCRDGCFECIQNFKYITWALFSLHLSHTKYSNAPIYKYSK